VTFVDNFYQNDANHHGFIYQNPSYSNSEYANPSTYRHAEHSDGKFENFKLATIYVKPQIYKGISSPADALKQGTAFAELYRPFVEKLGGHR
jgi:hypothetical protein